MDTALQSSVWVSSPEFAGWLIKRGFHWRKLWKKRWVALHGAEIVYMDKEPTLENSATMTITKAQITSATVIDREDLDGNPNGFAVHINDGNTPTWYLRAESAREKKSWLMRLSHVHAIVRWLEDFEKVKILGVGGTGIVYELLHKTNGQRFAMKEMEIKNKTQMEMAISEAEMLKDIMENISHPNIMHIEKVFQVGSKFYLVFPLCTGGELYEHIIRRGHFTEHDAALLMRDLISGLNALHQHDILHLDIKPENILFDSMNDDARIKITDFGLAKLFTNVQQDQKQQALLKNGMTIAQLMAERLKAFAESGELNRERLRGTVGYMSPELILTGQCSKATDVFAAGVVLYILLCGRPPFHSKSNREVLERTAKGVFRITGSEWNDISEEAKDLVKKMLVSDPDQRLSTGEILEHPWIKQLDEMETDSNSTYSDSLSSPHGSSDHAFSRNASAATRSNTSNSFGGRKGSGPNLTGALRLLSGHVQHMRSEKLAMSVTRLISVMHQNGGSMHSTLADQYLIPLNGRHKGGTSMSSSALTEESERETEEDGDGSASNEGGTPEGARPSTSGGAENSSVRNPEVSNNSGGLADGRGSSWEDREDVLDRYGSTDNYSGEQEVAMLMNQDVRGALANAISQFADTEASGGDKLTIEQFICILRHFGFAPRSGGATIGLGALLLTRFIDRDGDGYISADDIFTVQALVMQQSEVFLKAVFRVYTEAIWYPGRQLNLLNVIQHTNMKGPAAAENSSNANPTSTASTTPSSKQRVLDDGSIHLDVVDPPKFITSRHVAAVFEKLGYDPSCGTKVFLILCEALTRLRSDDENGHNSGSSGGRNGGHVDYSDDEDDTGENGGRGNQSLSGTDLPIPPPKSPAVPAKSVGTPNAALAAAFGGAAGMRSSGSATDLSKERTSSSAAVAGNGPFRKSFFSTSTAAAASSSTDAASSASNGKAGDVAGSKSSAAAASSDPASADANAKMDVKDFVRIAQLDDVLVQVIFRKPRSRLFRLIRKAMSISSSQMQEYRDQQNAASGTSSLSSSEKIRQNSASGGGTANGGGTSSGLRSLGNLLGMGSNTAPVNPSSSAISTGPSNTDSANTNVPAVLLTPTQIAASIFEEELKIAFGKIKIEDSRKHNFPIANAVGRAAFDFVGKMTTGAQALMSDSNSAHGGEGGGEPNNSSSHHGSRSNSITAAGVASSGGSSVTSLQKQVNNLDISTTNTGASNVKNGNDEKSSNNSKTAENKAFDATDSDSNLTPTRKSNLQQRFSLAESQAPDSDDEV